MIYPNLGSRQGEATSWIVNARTAKGAPVLKLDRDCDGQVKPEDPALVLRTGEGKNDWRPVANLAELKTALASKDAGSQLGLWTDKRSFLVFPKDGKVQGKEVQPLADLWNANRFSHVEADSVKRYGGAAEYTGYFYVKTDAANVKVDSAETPAGPVPTLVEPNITNKVNVDHVTLFVQDGSNWVPMSQKRYTYEPNKEVVIS